MKQTIRLLVLGLFVLAAACGKEEEGNNAPPPPPMPSYQYPPVPPGPYPTPTTYNWQPSFPFGPCGARSPGAYNWMEYYCYELVGMNSSGQFCTTGKQEFPTKADLCAGLADESRNQGCAYEYRMQRRAMICG